MSQYGFHLTASNVNGLEERRYRSSLKNHHAHHFRRQVVEAESLAEAMELAEAKHPGFRVVRGRCLDNYDASTGRAG